MEECIHLWTSSISLDELFSDFDPNPIGVASVRQPPINEDLGVTWITTDMKAFHHQLAQVHRAVDRRSGRRVAVKLQHPHLEEFAKIESVYSPIGTSFRITR